MATNVEQWAEANVAPNYIPRGERKQSVSVRMSKEGASFLASLSEKTGKARTRIAEELLEAAVRDAFVLLSDLGTWRPQGTPAGD